jgi:sec-independent protein translocase protein TatA
MFGSFGPMEIGLILLVVLVVFGAGKLPEVGGAIGKSIRSFKKAIKEPDEIDVTPKDEKEKS